MTGAEEVADQDYHRDCTFAMVTGKGRSGTTWLSQLLNTYPHCQYKHEPFLHLKQNAYSDWLDANADTTLSTNAASQLAQLCKQCRIDIDMPPFFSKSFHDRNKLLLQVLFTFGKRASFARNWYEQYGSLDQAENPETILIKEVNLSRTRVDLLNSLLAPKWILLVRNPYGNVASYLRGVRLGLFPGPSKGDLAHTRNMLAHSDDQSLRKWVDKVGHLPPAKFEALRWRVEVEPVYDFVNTARNGMVVVYEELCTRPQETLEGIFDFLGWAISTQTLHYLQKTVSRPHRGFTSSKRYYSIYRNPIDGVHGWKRELNEEQKREIVDVMHESRLWSVWADIS